jgi:hypothetical protein
VIRCSDVMLETIELPYIESVGRSLTGLDLWVTTLTRAMMSSNISSDVGLSRNEFYRGFDAWFIRV